MVEEEEEEEVALEEDFPIVADLLIVVDLSTIEVELERLANRSRKEEAAMGVATQLMAMAAAEMFFQKKCLSIK